jgi:Domain of unknown function (DUF4376)
MTTVIDALIALVPGTENNWSINGDLSDAGFGVTSNLLGITLPTKEQILAKLNELQLAQAKAAKKALIDKWSHTVIGSDIILTKNGVAHGIQTNYSFPPPEDQREIITVSMLGRISLMSDSDTATWITRENVTISLSKADMRAILTSFFERQTQAILQARAYKDQLDALQTLEEVAAFGVE